MKKTAKSKDKSETADIYILNDSVEKNKEKSGN